MVFICGAGDWSDIFEVTNCDLKDWAAKFYKYLMLPIYNVPMKISKDKQEIILAEVIEQHIFIIRRRKVILDTHLAELYQVETSHLNRAVRRNNDRFPKDFMFQLTREEFDFLRCQIGISNDGNGGRRYLPYAFTEQGVAMLSSVLRSGRAVAVNIAIMRTFVRLRQMLASNKELAEKVGEMEKKYDKQFKIVFDVLKQLMGPPLEDASDKNPIGFVLK